MSRWVTGIGLVLLWLAGILLIMWATQPLPDEWRSTAQMLVAFGQGLFMGRLFYLWWAYW